MAGRTPPFAGFEWMIAWRYLRARRAEGGVSVMTWISLIGITLAVFALIVTLAVRAGFREEFVDTILGANAHVTVYNAAEFDAAGNAERSIPDYEAMAARIAAVPGVTAAAPLIRGQVMANANGRNAGVEVLGIAPADLARIPGIQPSADSLGDIADFSAAPAAEGPGPEGEAAGADDAGAAGRGADDAEAPDAEPATGGGTGADATAPSDGAEDPAADGAAGEAGLAGAPAAPAAAGPQGIAIGIGVARELGVGPGGLVRLISPDGVQTPFGMTPRVKAYQVVYVFSAGRYDIDRTRIYMPFAEAQSYFNREGTADEIEVMVARPDRVEEILPAVIGAAGPRAIGWTWRDSAGGFLRALDVEDNVMFVILSILVLIAAMNIVSGLIMLVKNKGRDIGILRTMGLTEGSILRVFFICGASVGLAGTAAGLVLGCLFAIYIDPIFAFVNWAAGGGVWDPAIRGIYALPAKLQLADVAKAVGLSLLLSFGVTILPARRAARMNPVEALRYE